MKKIFILFMLFFSIVSTMPANSAVLEGKITYTEDSARKLAFEDVEKNIDSAIFQKYMQDPYYKENKEVFKHKIQLSNRSVQIFRGFVLPAYAVTYNDNLRYTYYYVKGLNQLAFVDIDETDPAVTEVSFPYRIYRYDFTGRLIAVGIYVSEEERFLYKSNGKLISHWVGNDGYNRRGRKIGTVEEADNIPE